MTYFNKEQVSLWRDEAAKFLAAHNLTIEAITAGRDAWSVAYASGITHKAYDDPNVVDAHIQTALASIFPNAIFRDKKVY